MAVTYVSGNFPVKPSSPAQYEFAESVIKKQLEGTSFEFVGFEFGKDTFGTFKTRRGETVQQWQIFGTKIEDWRIGAMDWSIHESKLEAYEWKLAALQANRRAIYQSQAAMTCMD